MTPFQGQLSAIRTARHRFFCAWPVFRQGFAKSFVAARAPKTMNRAIEKRGRDRSTKHRKIFEKTIGPAIDSLIAPMIAKASRNGRKWRPGGSQKRARAPKSSEKARPSASGASEKYKQARTSDFGRRKRAAKAQRRRQCPEGSRPSKENLLKDIYIYIYIYMHVCVHNRNHIMSFMSHIDTIISFGLSNT